ncbi:transglycosylase domain-containing protein [Pseudooceanicola aestuarii]|uniref:transglycosylase domain-containing protein n=1 Tax=Pseudooceanicola aestuarii TaxID=2697319 RepID=UPI0013D78529|nr:transglycosylase domain-containing protein [Pseudooceanicola aestuarii]
MSDSGRRKPPLVAEKRYGQSQGRKKPATRKPATGKSRPRGGSGGSGGKRPPGRGRGPARRGPKRRGNPVLGVLSGITRWVLRLVWNLSWRLIMVVGLLIVGSSAYIASTLPEYDQLLDGRSRGSVTMLDDTGQVFAWRGDQYGGEVTASTVSPYLRNAIVATEDKRFYKHFGVSPRGIASAIRINLREGRGPLQGHGGSTITQQTAKLLCLGRDYDPDVWKNEREYEADCRRTTLWRKAKEAVFSVAMEMRYSKDEILSIYMNRAFLGAGARGFEAASQRYFGKSAANVTAAESAMLAGLLVAPTRYAPTNDLSRSQRRASVIIGLMEDQGYLDGSEARQARANPAELSEAAEAEAGGYFADWVMSSGPDFLTRDTTEDVIIRTTLDQRIQRAAEDAMQTVFETKVREGSKAQAAIVVMSADGAVRGMVGGRKLRVSGVFNRATQAKRQSGSAFKPFVYATALELGWSAFDMVDDTPLTINIPGSGAYTPENYDRKFRGPVTLEQALMQSLNIPAIRISEAVGRDNVRRVASDFGIYSDLAEGPAIALGASETTLVEMVGAYAGILNGGSSVTPYGLVEVRLMGDDEPMMDSEGGIGERVIREEAARELIWMLHQVVTRGTGSRAGIDGWQIAGKTGTSQSARDAWFVGFSADYVTGVWMGYDDNTPLTGVTGSGLPAEIFRETMDRVHDGLEPTPLPMSEPTPPARPQPVQDPNQAQQRNVSPLERALKDIFGIR